MRTVVLTATAIGTAYLCYKFAAWRVIAQVSLTALMFVWVLICVAMIGSYVRSKPRGLRGKLGINVSEATASAREAYVAKYGMAGAEFVEKNNPLFWKEIALGLRPQP